MLNLISGKIYEFQFTTDDGYNSESYFANHFVNIGDQSFSAIDLEVSDENFLFIEFKALVLQNKQRRRDSKTYDLDLLIVGTSTIVQTMIEIPYYMLETKVQFESYPKEDP